MSVCPHLYGESKQWCLGLARGLTLEWRRL